MYKAQLNGSLNMWRQGIMYNAQLNGSLYIIPQNKFYKFTDIPRNA